MAPDPNLFLSTIILASAALVAIIGGLLVARFVGLDADQQTNRRVLIDADGRLASARRRAAEAQHGLADWDAWDFFSEPDVLAAVGRGVSDPAKLRRLEPCPLSEDELRPFIKTVKDEFAQARKVLAGQLSESDYNWYDFRKARSDLPESEWPMVWRRVFDEIVEKRVSERRAEAEKARKAGQLWGLDPTAFLTIPSSKISDLARMDSHYDRQRRDDLAAGHARAQQRVEDYEDELRRLRDEHAEIIRPDKRLWIGVVILAVFAGVGVAWPLYVMSTGPADLASVWWLIWPFCGVLAALVGYVVVYLFNLSRRKLPPVQVMADLDQTEAGN